MTKHVLAGVLFVFLVGCASPAINQVASLETRLKSTEQEAIKYFRLPTCSSKVKVNCKTKAKAQEILSKEGEVYKSILQAHNDRSQASINDAGARLKSFEDMVAALPKAH